jgi:hypothetical protein
MHTAKRLEERVVERHRRGALCARLPETGSRPLKRTSSPRSRSVRRVASDDQWASTGPLRRAHGHIHRSLVTLQRSADVRAWESRDGSEGYKCEAVDRSGGYLGPSRTA